MGQALQFRKTRLLGRDVVLAKPMTYMNESGQAAAKLRRMFDLELADMLVIYDDIDLPLGQVRLRERGSAGSHKGMRSIIQHLGSPEFPRLRIGIRPDRPEVGDLVHYVLTPLRGGAFDALRRGAERAADAAEAVLGGAIHDVMNRYNRRQNSLLPPAGEASQSSTRRTHD
jgi:PTH1 family peptidyl-tRNA hydrolase